SKTWTTNEVLGFEGDVEIRPFDGTNILLGAEYNDFDWESKGVDLDENGIEDPASKSIAKGDMHTTGLFAEAQYRPCGYFKALVGLRHEDNSEFGTEYIPRYGLIINPFENTALKLNHGKHFNAPTLNDLFWPYEDWGWGMGTEGNPNLEPETGWHTDATVEQSFCDDKLFLTLSYFDWDIDDKITWIPDADFFYRPENLDTYNADGWELGVDVGPYYGLTLGLGYTYMDAEEKLAGGVKRQAIYTPDDYFKADLAYWTNFGFNATATLRYTGDRPARYALPTDTRPEHTLSSYYTLDLKLEQRLYDNWLFSFQCNNLFDEEYDTYVESFMNPSTFASTLAGFPGAGRSVFFNISYEY
ncbi:MAG: TonB-dependent receptor, partial [Desulfobacterales bacterium]|nr:TonB-dependent receptor [Desulfobacterales bacterium]